MALRTVIALTFAIGTAGFAGADNRVAFRLNEPVSVAGVPPVTLGPGSYILRTVSTAGRANVVQILSKQWDYVYTTVLTIPAQRQYSDDKEQILFSETPSGTPPALHYWFPAGQTLGHEFLNPRTFSTSEQDDVPKQLKSRIDGSQSHAAQSEGSAADANALREVLIQIESGKLGAARDSFRRNYFLDRNRQGATISFLLALLMADRVEAIRSLESVRQLDPERMGAMVRLGVYGVVETLPDARPNPRASLVRRFLLNLALDRTDDPIVRSAVLSFERNVAKVDSFPVEMAIDRRREEREKERRNEEQWVLANGQIAKLNDCVKALLNKVGALEYSGSGKATLGPFGSVRWKVVLTPRRLNDLDAIVERSHRTICDRHLKLERLIAQRNAAISRELDSLRSTLRELDKEPGSTSKSQYTSLRKWDSAAASGVSRDLMTLSETASMPSMRLSSVLRTNGGSVQINIAASLAMLAEWAGL